MGKVIPPHMPRAVWAHQPVQSEYDADHPCGKITQRRAAYAHFENVDIQKRADQMDRVYDQGKRKTALCISDGPEHGEYCVEQRVWDNGKTENAQILPRRQCNSRIDGRI